MPTRPGLNDPQSVLLPRIEKVAMRITELRTKKNMSKRELAASAGISYGYLWRLEAARQDPTLTVLEKIARSLKVPVGRLLK